MSKAFEMPSWKLLTMRNAAVPISSKVEQPFLIEPWELVVQYAISFHRKPVSKPF